MTETGKKVKKVVEADSLEDAISKIRELGEYPVKIAPSVIRTAVITVGRKTKPYRTSLVGVGLIFLLVLVVVVIMKSTEF